VFRTTLLSIFLITSACKRQTPVVAAASASPNLAASAPASSTLDPVTVAAMQEILANFERVHFETDSSTLGAPARDALADNARILVEHPTIRVEVQGHADERGTIDYNMALGQRRADTVSRALTTMGVGPVRVHTVSFGEERPVARGGSEQAWSQNRRCEFRVTAGAGAAGTTL
jgi:peptidoglycan-associated lipoprotein